MQKTYALFDFDGTLRKGDSIIALCLYARRKGLCSAFQLWHGAWAAVRYGCGLLSAEKAKQAALGWTRGRLESEMDVLGQEFCLQVLLPQMYPEGLAAIAEEKKRGASVLLITASPSFYLEPLRDLLGVEDVIGTRMVLDDTERFTGELFGENCKGVQKPLRLAEYLAAKGDRLDYDSSRAYGDSGSDFPMMELCREKVAVDPKKKLRKALKKTEHVTCVQWGTRAAK